VNANRLALDLLRLSGTARLLHKRCAGVGALLTLHHVRPRSLPRPFSPNRILEISPDFLEAAISELQLLGYEFISLDEFHRRMIEADFSRKFVSFTLDDGYVDNFTHAYPIFKQYNVPFAIYICTGIMERTTHLWWRELEEIVQKAQAIRVEIDGAVESFSTTTTAEKHKAFNQVYWRLRAAPLDRQLDAMQRLREKYDHSFDSRDSEPLSWEMVSEMHASGLMTIGGHTVNHYAMSKLSSESLRDEVERGCEIIREHTQIRPKHFAYPYGDQGSAGRREFAAARDAGFATAVTTRKGIIVPEQANELFGIPRISLNGDFQRRRFLRTLMTGVPTALYQRINRSEATC
jgi:peptidoglycan/xylan/chitin deacetylase (PgdA/CDA1 family)